MGNLIKNWNGNLRGTNTGRLHLKVESQEQNNIQGILRVNDDKEGLLVYSITGTYENSLLSFSGELDKEKNLQHVLIKAQLSRIPIIGEINGSATLTAHGSLSGEWNSSIGTAGTFTLFPDNLGVSEAVEIEAVNQKLVAKNINLGVIRLELENLKYLLEEIKKAFPSGRITITYPFVGQEITSYLEDFYENIGNLSTLNTLKIFAQERETSTISRIVSIKFDKNLNSLHIESSDRIWVNGQIQLIEDHLKPFQNFTATWVKKLLHKLFEPLVIIAILIILPSIGNLLHRVYWFVPTFILLFYLNKINRKLVPNFVLYINRKNKHLIAWLWPVISLVMGILTPVISGLLAQYLGINIPS